ncbi:MAG: hypothetical protein ACE15E_20480 [Acidobacteriota bacterium]
MSFNRLGSVLSFIAVLVLFAPRNSVLAGEGDLDPSFGTGGKLSADITGQLLDDAVGDVALLPDGRILVAGTTSSGFPSEHDVAVVVFEPDGSLDESFGQGGRVLIDRGGNEFCDAVVVQPDGRVLLGGYRTTLPDGPPESLVFRLNPDGVLDTTFGNQEAFEPVLSFAVVDLALLPDGAIAAAGSRPSPSGSDFAIARLTSSGILDNEFGMGGVVILDFGADDYLTQLSIDPDGRLVAAGLNTAGGLEVSRLLPDGSPDLSFFGAGQGVVDLTCFYDVSTVIQQDGKMVVGTATGGAGLSNFLLARFNPDGSLDAGFGTDGVVTGDLTGTDDYLTCVTLQPDGKILAVGWAGFYPDFLVQRYHPDGSVDLSFGLGGWVHTDFIGDKDRARAAIIQTNGQFLLAGDVPGSDVDESRDFGLARYEITTVRQQAEVRVNRSARARSGRRVNSIR